MHNRPKYFLPHFLGSKVIEWSAILEQHGPCVWRTAYRLLSDRDEASDCYQETFLKVYEYSQQREIKNWPGLLRRIATSRALDRLRQRYRTPDVLTNHDDETVMANNSAPERQLEHQEWMQLLRQAVSELPENQAQVFWLSEVEKMSSTQIAAELSASAQQIATWLHRAKRKLRQTLTARGLAGEVPR